MELSGNAIQFMVTKQISEKHLQDYIWLLFLLVSLYILHNLYNIFGWKNTKERKNCGILYLCDSYFKWGLVLFLVFLHYQLQ